MAMSKEEFRRRWNSGPDGGGITCDDCADCYVAWGLGNAPRTKPIANVITSVCAAAGCDEAAAQKEKVEAVNTPGNAAALREALDGVLSALEDAGFHPFVYGDPLAEAVLKARAALSAPPRNCDRLRDLVRRMIPGVEENLAIAKAEGERIKGLCALKGVDSSEVDEVLEYWTAILREAREAVGESMKDGAR